jgi:outer membrane receptor for ferrienterochelin and colicins
MANARLFWDHTPSGWMASLRAIYRSRWGVIDRDGNGFANRPDEFAEGMLHVNMTVSKRIKENWMVQFGVNNLLNQTNAMFMPNMPGTNWFTTLTYTFKHKNK